MSQSGAFTVEAKTAEVYGELWGRYDDQLFLQSVELFEKRWIANGEDPRFFAGKHCLDAGCGGGRFSIAMARLGASSVAGIDLSDVGLQDARRRQAMLALPQIEFRTASVLELPFGDGEFDFVCCSGVLHHTPSIERGLREIHRVLKPGGCTYLLLYGAGGLFWPSNALLRPLAGLIGRAGLDRAIQAAGLADNRRRSILDDLYVPILETYGRERLQALLAQAGFLSQRYWNAARMDHESSPHSMLEELNTRLSVWLTAARQRTGEADAGIWAAGANILQAVTRTAETLIRLSEAGSIAPERVRETVIGAGHHRLLAFR